MKRSRFLGSMIAVLTSLLTLPRKLFAKPMQEQEGSMLVCCPYEQREKLNDYRSSLLPCTGRVEVEESRFFVCPDCQGIGFSDFQMNKGSRRTCLSSRKGNLEFQGIAARDIVPLGPNDHSFTYFHHDWDDCKGYVEYNPYRLAAGRNP